MSTTHLKIATPDYRGTPRPTTNSTASADTVSGGPRRWLRVEALVLLVGALIAFSTTSQPWWLVPALILLPDLAWVGYLGGTRVGAFVYNAAHATPMPTMMIGIGWWQHRPLILAFGLVWLAHIGVDRLQGYGLKYDDSFQHTHLGSLGRSHRSLPTVPRMPARRSGGRRSVPTISRRRCLNYIERWCNTALFTTRSTT